MKGTNTERKRERERTFTSRILRDLRALAVTRGALYNLSLMCTVIYGLGVGIWV